MSARLRSWCLAAVVLATAMAGCERLVLPFVDHRETAFELAAAGGLSPSTVHAAQFAILTFHRGLGAAPQLHVYLEGDGRAWRRRNQLSRDPTPWHPVALALAVRDPRPAVLYVARPCQYLLDAERRRCPARYWSSHRMAPEVIDAMEAVLDWALGRWPDGSAPRVGVVGFSGGGAVGALLADRRRDIDWLVTVAAPLDLDAWTTLHRVTPLTGSLDPARAPGGRLRGLPQLHLVGRVDRNVPPGIAQSYLERLGHPSSARLRIVERFGHRCCWADLWPAPLCKFAPGACPTAHSDTRRAMD